MPSPNPPPPTYAWGNAIYVDLSVGDAFSFLGKDIALLRIENQRAVVRIGATEVRLTRVERALPSVVEGARVFLADNRNVKSLTTDPDVHGLLQRDALLCLSDASKPLLDPARYAFPISREDGYGWSMEEASAIFAYYGIPWSPSKGAGYLRSHEGIDFNLHDGRGIEKHPQVAIEDGVAHWVKVTNADEACAAIQSASDPNIYYIYQHLCNRLLRVADGQAVAKGQAIAYNWGDGSWGHLHLAVTHRPTPPTYEDRYTNVLNVFPQMYELWHGDLAPRPRVWTRGRFAFAHPKAQVENKLHLSAYNDINGYGWRIADWCAAGAMQRHPYNSGSIAFKKTLHAGHPAEARNPEDHYAFEVAVEPGAYAVSAQVGDVLRPTWQRVGFNRADAGLFELAPAQLAWTDEIEIDIPDGRLVLRIALRDDETYAGISQLHFAKVKAPPAASPRGEARSRK